MMSAPDISSILENSKELDRLRKEQEDVLTDINKMHKKLQTTPEVVDKHGDNSLTKLKNLYARAKELSEIEVRVSNALLGQLDALLPPAPPGPRRRIEGNEQKKKQKKNDSDISRVSSYLRNQLDSCASLKGEQVAARVKSEDPEKDEYIVVKVINFDKETREKFKLPMSHIIPFPKRNDPSAAPDFPIGRAVLAVYPGTTTLYKATVVNPSRKRKTDDYPLEFDDDESEDGSMPQRTVPFYNVVPLPEGHRQ